MALLAEYPKNVSSTAFASFLEIERLQYKKGLEKAGGATESLLTSNLAGILGAIGGLRLVVSIILEQNKAP